MPRKKTVIPHLLKAGGKHPDDKPGGVEFDHEDPIVVHVPQDSVIVTINLNMVLTEPRKDNYYGYH